MATAFNFFDLASMFGGGGASPAAGGAPRAQNPFGFGGGVTGKIASQDLLRLGASSTQQEGFGSEIEQAGQLYEQLLGGYGTAQGLGTREDIQKQFSGLGKSAQANLASQGYFNSSLRGVVADDAATREQAAIRNFEYEQSQAGAAAAQDAAYQERIQSLEKDINALLGQVPAMPAPAPIQPAPTPTPSPPTGGGGSGTGGTTAPRNGARRQIGTAYGSPVYEVYNAASGVWEQARI